MRYYRPVSLILGIIFAAVGLVFLFGTDIVLTFFNDLSEHLGMLTTPVNDIGFYPLLAVGYMYLVTILAFRMYLHPENTTYPLLLTHGKLASSILSMALFLIHERYLIYITNFAVDGFIAVVVLLFYLGMKKNT